MAKKKSNTLIFLLSGVVLGAALGFGGMTAAKDSDFFKDFSGHMAAQLGVDKSDTVLYLPNISASFPLNGKLHTAKLRMAIKVRADEIKKTTPKFEKISDELHQVLTRLKPIDFETAQSWGAVTKLLRQTVKSDLPHLETQDVFIIELLVS